MADELGRADHEWRIGQESFVALPVAAALAFHQAQGRSSKAIGSREDHDDALNIAASALSRLVTIHVMDQATSARIPLKLDVGKGKFMRGATEFHGSDGVVLVGMTVRRADLASALSLIGRVGIPFALAVGEAQAPAAQPEAPAKRPASEER